MAAQTQKITHAAGGITPLGSFTITPGTPQSILANTKLASTRYALMCRQIGFSVSKSVSGEVYVNYGNYSGGVGVPDNLATVLTVQSSSSQSLPIGERTSDGMIDATQFYLDGSAACVVSVYLLDASSS
jgi:hypothetical protein